MPWEAEQVSVEPALGMAGTWRLVRVAPYQTVWACMWHHAWDAVLVWVTECLFVCMSARRWVAVASLMVQAL